MTFFLAVLLPLIAQSLFTIIVVFGAGGGGSFVPLGVMLLGPPAILITALVNWARTRRKTPLAPLQIASHTLFTTLSYPALVVIALAVAS